MIAGRVSLRGNLPAGKKRMPCTSESNESVSEQYLGADLWRRVPCHTDLQINLPFPKRARIFFGLRYETQADAGRSLGSRRDQGSGKDVHKPFVGANDESPFE